MPNQNVTAVNLRQGERKESSPVRTSRFFKSGDYWYYSTREGVDIGPYDHREAAEMGCSEFIEFVRHTNPAFSDTLQNYQRMAS